MAAELKRVLVEALIVSTLGLAISLTANLVSPRGLSLTRNYFPGTGSKPAHPPSTAPAEANKMGAAPSDSSPGNGPGLAGGNSNGPIATQGTNRAGQATGEIVIARLKEHGLQPIDGKQAVQLFRDPQYEQELIVFVDARDERHYLEGHIPGAYQFDRYYPEKYLPAVLPACLNAAKVVVYCTGENCEDSEFAAVALKEAGVPQERLFVFAGGMTEWSANGLTIEVGDRKSGNVRETRP